MALVAAVGACGGESGVPGTRLASAGHSQGQYKVGSPYQVNGTWYYPAEDFTYDQTGEASWYGPGFHGHVTANGEVFDQDEMTAAHTTLQLPSLVRVTNLRNGRSTVLRVNDRGPFRYDRIIDVSRRAAEVLGFVAAGTAPVRVQVLEHESRLLAEAARRGDDTSGPTEAVLASLAQAAPPAVVSAGPDPADAGLGPVVTSNLLAIPSAMPAALAAQPAPPAVRSPPSDPAVSLAANAPDPIAVLAVSALASAQPQAVQGAPADRFFVEAGAFVDYDNAELLRERLAAFGPADISSGTVNGVRFHRVRLGPVGSLSDADRLLGQVQSAGQPSARIVTEN